MIELLVVLAILGICMTAGSVSLAYAVRTQQARGAAQNWQAAAGWAQVGVLWHGGSVRLSYAPGSLALSHDFGICGGDLGQSAPTVSVTANLARWRDPEGVAVTFGGALASPDGGGSLHFQASKGSYRVTVRPESGLTVRSWVEAAP